MLAPGAAETTPTDITAFTFLLFLLWLMAYGTGRLGLDATLRRVLRLELGRTEHELLRALVDGVSLGDVLAMAGAKQKSARRRDRIFRWFRTWVAEGLSTGVDVGPPVSQEAADTRGRVVALVATRDSSEPS